MKRVGVLFLFVSLVIMFMVSSAFAAGIVGTPHDVRGIDTDLGVCSTCHIPHKSTGNRLWFNNMVTGASGGTVGELCSECHGGGGGYGAGLLDEAGGAALTVFAPNAHQLLSNYYTQNATESNVADWLSSPTALTSFPYAGAGSTGLIECTTCHNVHDNSNFRPFLRASIRDICVKCHTRRHINGAGALVTETAESNAIGNWDTNLVGVNNPGTHPVGINISGNVSGGDTPIITWTGSGTVWDTDVAITQLSSPIRPWTEFKIQPFDEGGTGTNFTPSDPLQAGYATWNLGRHVADVDNAGGTLGVPGDGTTGGVVCVSCHAIHGVQNDSDITIVQQPPSINLLAMPQATSTYDNEACANGGNGDGTDGLAIGPGTDPANFLCESCHHADDTTGFFKSNDNDADYGGKYYPNPGGEAYTHPIDDATVVNDIVSSFAPSEPVVWPNGGAGGAGASWDPGKKAASPIPICESCHLPHPAWSIHKNRGDVVGTSSEYLLRSTHSNICNSCHTTADFSHHPTGPLPANVSQNLLTTNHPDPWTSTEPGADGMIGDGDAAGELTCGDCHNGGGAAGTAGAAHNWPGKNALGLDPDWMPVNNGRNSTDTMAEELKLSDRQSDTCELCHYLLRTAPTATVQTPTAYAADAYRDTVGQFPEVDGRETIPPDEFQRHGSGTHFLGTIDTSSADSAVRQWALGVVYDPDGAGEEPFDPRTQAWPNGNTFNDTNTAWSRWGTTTAGEHLVCESCHELEPDKNAPGSKLLVYFFQENKDSPRTGDNSGTSYFCEGCHGKDGPIGTHPMTGNTVSRTGTLLSTVITNPLLSAAAPSAVPSSAWSGSVAAGTSTFPTPTNDTDMSCDSCHQVHDGPDNAGTYILDGPNGNFILNAGGYVQRGGANHPTAPANLDYTGFCDQCHWYTDTSR
jgi:predicted CXXCH cytochrome family protein